VFVDAPLGSPVGRPGDEASQREVLRGAFAVADAEWEPWRVRTLDFDWSGRGDRAWEDTVRELYRRQLSIVRAHQASHARAGGESLVGREREFTIRCDC
jgi:hypothetical protein